MLGIKIGLTGMVVFGVLLPFFCGEYKYPSNAIGRLLLAAMGCSGLMFVVGLLMAIWSV